MFNADGSVRFTARPFGDSYTGGVRVATGDVTGDGVPDVVAGTNGNTYAQVRVIDGATGKVRPEQLFGQSWHYGAVSVATGDVTGDGVADIALGTDEGGPRAQVIRGGDFAKLADFKAGPRTNYWGRTQVALGDVNGDHIADLMVAGLYPNGSHVSGYNGQSLRPGTAPTRVFNEFTLDGTFANSLFLAAGDINGDGRADVIVGSGAYGTPKVVAFSGKQLAESNTRVKLADFVPEGATSTTGIRVAVRDVDGDGVADILTASGERATIFRGGNLPAVGTRPPVVRSFDPFPDINAAVYVG